MFRICAVVLGLAACAVAPALGQRKELTALAGGTLSGATGGNLAQVQTRAGFAVGLSLRLPRTPELSLQTDLLVVQRRLVGQRPPSTQSPLQAGPLDDAANLAFVEIPILLRIERGYSKVRPVRPFVLLGPYVGLRVYCSREVTAANGSSQHTTCDVANGSFTAGSETFLPAVYQELDLGLLAGAGVEIHQFALGLRFERSFRNLVEPGGAVQTSPFDSSRLWTALVSVEYLIRVL